MDVIERLKLLGKAASFEPAEEVDVCASKSVGMIYQAAVPGGQRIPLLKTLLTSACEMNCAYCPYRKGRDTYRVTLTPDELAHAFMQLHRKGLVKGIFVSSGVAGGSVRAADRLIAAAEILRHKYRFGGYIHLKIMPGAEPAQVEAAMHLADRVSVNLEAPDAKRLSILAPNKDFFQLWQRLRWIAEIRRRMSWHRPSFTSQFVVGAAGESDRELLTTVEALYRLGAARAYFSGFRPIPDTPLDHLSPLPPPRERNLYRASFLLRDYGFAAAELPFDDNGNLPTTDDPKLAWARLNLQESPVELNTASRRELLRVPGIGPKGAERLLRARRLGTLRDLADLRQLGIAARRAAPFILLDGRRPAYQLPMFPGG